MTTTAADVLVEGLQAWGVDTIFGIPGDGINGVIEALRKKRDAVRFILVRHEESAAFMACAYAKFTGKLGCCLSTSGPGGIHLLNGLYDAKMDGQPVIAITGLQYHDLTGTFTQQDVALDRLFMDVAAFNERVMGPTHVENMVELACRTAVGERQPTHLTIAIDHQSEPVKSDGRSERNLAHHVSNARAIGHSTPAPEQLRHAAEVLNAGGKVAILAGAGALGCERLLAEVADTLAAPVAKALLGKAAFPDDHPYCVGGVGLLGTAPAQEAMEGCDTLLIVGSTFPYIEYYPKPGKARGVQIDIDSQALGLRFPVECAMLGDTASTLTALAPLLERKSDRRFLEHAQRSMRDWNETLSQRGEAKETPMKGDVPMEALNRLLPDGATVVTDCGINTAYAARHLRLRSGMLFSTSGTLASMGGGLPYAIAAKLAHPIRPTIAVVGDGGFTMTMGEMATAVKYGADVKVIVLKNDSLGQIKWEQMAFLGNPEYVCDLQPIDFAMVARGFGWNAHAVQDPKEVESVLAAALAEPGPSLVEITIDQNDPLLPPKIKAKQAMNFAKALVHGTPGRGAIIKDAVGDVVREIV